MSSSSMKSIFAAAARADSPVPQTRPLKGQVANPAGGFSHVVTDDDRIRRAIVLGTTGSTYYSTATSLSSETATFINRMISEGKGQMILDILMDIHRKGSSPKMHMTFAVLALLTRCKDDSVRANALQFVGMKGLRTLSQVYMWFNCHVASGTSKGTGRGVRSALSSWVSPRCNTVKNLAYQVVKYMQREGCSIKDILAMAHPTPNNTTKKGATTKRREWSIGHQIVIAYAVATFKKATKGRGLEVILNRFCDDDWTMSDVLLMPKIDFIVALNARSSKIDDEATDIVLYLWTVEKVKNGTSPEETSALISEHNLPREVVATPMLNHKIVWVSLLIANSADLKIIMPITALIRNLAKMTSLDLFNTSLGDSSYQAATRAIVKAVCDHITNEDVIRRGRVHPATFVTAGKIYSRGRGDKGSLTWSPHPDIVKALADAVEIAFYTIEPSSKVHLHALDISGSMSCADSAVPYVTAMEASIIQMLCHLKTNIRNDGGRQIVMVFDTTGRVVFDSNPDSKAYEMDIWSLISRPHYSNFYSQSKTTGPLFDPIADDWQSVCDKLSHLPMSGTDCAQPILLGEKMITEGVARPEVFSVYTDNETYFGKIHPSDALKKYRRNVPDAKMMVIAATPTERTISDPNDSGSLDICGWDTSAGTLIHDFINGNNDADGDAAAGGGAVAAGGGAVAASGV